MKTETDISNISRDSLINKTYTLALHVKKLEIIKILDSEMFFLFKADVLVKLIQELCLWVIFYDSMIQIL